VNIKHKHEHPDFRAPRHRKVARLKQLNKSNRIFRRHVTANRYNAITVSTPAAAA
jgi:hypothetical protein